MRLGSAATKFCTTAPNTSIFASSVWNFFDETPLAHTILRWILNFGKFVHPCVLHRWYPLYFELLTRYIYNEYLTDKGQGRTGREGSEGEKRYSSTLSLNSVLDGGKWSTSRPGRLTPEKDPVPIYRRMGGHQRRSGGLRKNSTPRYDPRTVQPVSSPCTN